MFIVWRGCGILVPLVAVVVFFVTVIIGDSVAIPTDYLFLPAGLLAGGFLWWFGRKVNDPAKDRVVRDEATGERLRLRTRHDFFWIRIEYWAVLLVLFALVIAGSAVLESFGG